MLFYDDGDMYMVAITQNLLSSLTPRGKFKTGKYSKNAKFFTESVAQLQIAYGS
jgi:hypothetical protein